MMTDNLSLTLRIRQILAYIVRAAKKYLKINKTIYVQSRIPEYRRYWNDAAESLKLDFVPLTDVLWEIRKGDRAVRVANYKIPINDPVAFHICADKTLCYKFAMEQGVPVPQHCLFGLKGLAAAKQYMQDNPGIYVIKPAHDTGSGRGVTTQIRTTRQMERAAILASTYCNEFLLEKMVPAESLKLLFLDGKLLHASRRTGVRVVGDGRQTVRQLMANNAGKNVPLDLNAQLTLEGQGLSPDSVLPDGEVALVRSFPLGETNCFELRTVYDETITELVCPELRDECLRIVHAVGCELASVDVVTNDPGHSLAEAGGIFIEVNANPGIHHHFNDEKDREQSVAVSILEYLFAIH